MHVNIIRFFFGTTARKLFSAILMLLIGVIFMVYGMDGNPESISKRANLAVRAVGHNLLLQAGDSTSIVPPVIEKSKGVFLLEFRHEFGLEPDSLVAIVQRTIMKTPFLNYTVTVQQCNQDHIVYGFEINSPGDINISCRGRSLPQDCYNIEIAFADFPESSVLNPKSTLLVGGILSLLSIVLIGSNVGTKKSTPLMERNRHIQSSNDSIFKLGRFEFNEVSQTLKINEETISLTDKECKVLTLLSRNMGHLTLREELIQGVWTDEGVITGRSLDMFISKLRRKLNEDPDLRITNIHGKGYRLENLKDNHADSRSS